MHSVALADEEERTRKTLRHWLSSAKTGILEFLAMFCQKSLINQGLARFQFRFQFWNDFTNKWNF